MIYLSKIEDVLSVKSGCLIIPGIPAKFEIPVNVGDKIKIKKSDGTSVDTFVKGIELISKIDGAVYYVPILLPKDIKKNDLPVGSEVFLFSTNKV